MYILREYYITEWVINAKTRDEAEKKLYGPDCQKLSEWLEKTSLRKVKEDGGKPEGK